MPLKNSDVVIVGAGAAGLACAEKLTTAGYGVLVLEARDRIGGRIWTVQEEGLEIPIELGAEFVHGAPAEILDRAAKYGFELLKVEGDRWCSWKQRLCDCADIWERFDDIFQKMDPKKPDQSFLDFLNSSAPDLPEDMRAWVLGYIQGFEAAKPELISVHSLIRENEGGDEGDESFRMRTGYTALLEAMEKDLDASLYEIRLNTVVSKLDWKPGSVKLTTAAGEAISAKHAVITVPLEVLKSESPHEGAIQFFPELPEKKEAMKLLETGPVLRVTLHFRERFWDGISAEGKTLSELGFLFSDSKVFPTWWSLLPRHAPVLVGWCAGPKAELLRGRSRDEVIEEAKSTLARVLHISRNEMDSMTLSAHLHDWQADPFALGGYSYAAVGGFNAAEELGRPVADTLFFAGEATDSRGHNGTVHAALASGRRAAEEILRSKTPRGTT